MAAKVIPVGGSARVIEKELSVYRCALIKKNFFFFQ